MSGHRRDISDGRREPAQERTSVMPDQHGDSQGTVGFWVSSEINRREVQVVLYLTRGRLRPTSLLPWNEGIHEAEMISTVLFRFLQNPHHLACIYPPHNFVSLRPAPWHGGMLKCFSSTSTGTTSACPVSPATPGDQSSKWKVSERPAGPQATGSSMAWGQSLSAVGRTFGLHAISAILSLLLGEEKGDGGMVWTVVIHAQFVNRPNPFICITI